MKNSGKVKIEFFLVMILLILFGVSTFSLVAGASKAYSRKSAENQAKDSIRLASAYVQSRIGQANDRKKVDVVPNPVTNENSIRIEEDYNGEVFYTWVYFDQGSLKEAFIGKDVALEDSYAFEIANLDSFEITKSGKLIIVDLSAKSQDKTYTNNIIIDSLKN
ncbi:DUF4860 domain-containing protein [Criibacterium bergeronii]|uniref:DUF4860 domain-containing protein n=1 Tax=Criibacterium bergeronii TaxID=1871336 RepID=A0A371IJ65_9FIRM|nr:DUF4860 domain-containing protein [Criibacterium bergeronii]RDY20516.1 DUF4860 domain-containing protein [Criibacterium bergeronii]